jgi:hypothetical protein
MTAERRTSGNRSWLFYLASILFAGIVGFAVGACWILLIRWRPNGDPSSEFSLPAFATALALTGLVVGAVRRAPLIVGLVAGVVFPSIWALFDGPKDGWMLVWLFFYGSFGLICGAITGVLFYALGRPFRERFDDESTLAAP